MQNRINNKKIVAASVIFSAVVLSILRIFVIIHNIDIESIEDSYYFLSTSDTTFWFAISTLIILFLIGVIGFIISNDNDPQEYNFSPFNRYFAGFNGLALLIGVFYNLLSPSIETSGTPLNILLLIFAILTSFYLFNETKTKKSNSSLFPNLFSNIPVIYFALRLLETYIEHSTAQSSSSLPYLLLSLISFLLFFLASARTRIKKESFNRFYAFAFIAIITSFIYSIPTIFLSLFWKLPTGVNVVNSAIDIVFAINIFTIFFKSHNRSH